MSAVPDHGRREAPAGLPANIDPAAVSIVVDEDIHRPLGTGFYFLRRNYFVTAKHVIMDRDTGGVRTNLVLMQNGPNYPQAKVAFIHPEVDLAVLSISQPGCDTPLFPSSEKLIGQHGLRYWGYMPSQSDTINHRYVVAVVDIPAYQLEDIRHRREGNEQLLRFQTPFAETGHSGGPVLGIGGGVMAVIVEGHEGWARATDIQALLPHVVMQFPNAS